MIRYVGSVGWSGCADRGAIELDRDKSVMQFDVCTTVDELEQRVTENANRRPVFFYSLPQNVQRVVYILVGYRFDLALHG